MSKPKYISVTDQREVEELMDDPGDLAKPFLLKPNGHLWADSDQLDAWRLQNTSASEPK